MTDESLQRIAKASPEARSQAITVAERPLLTLPAAWFEPQVAECMADWIDRFTPVGAS